MALENAYKAIRNGQCSAAVVGGVNLLLKPHTSVQFMKLGMLSPDGACKAFDASGKALAWKIVLLYKMNLLLNLWRDALVTVDIAGLVLVLRCAAWDIPWNLSVLHSSIRPRKLPVENKLYASFLCQWGKEITVSWCKLSFILCDEQWAFLGHSFLNKCTYCIPKQSVLSNSSGMK